MEKRHELVFVSYNPVVQVCGFTFDGSRCTVSGVAKREDCESAMEAYAKRVDEWEESHPAVHRYSKLGLYASLVKAGLWDAVEAWLRETTVDGMNAWRAFDVAQNLSDDHPLFAEFTERIKSELGVDGATVSAILEAAEIKEG